MDSLDKACYALQKDMLKNILTITREINHYLYSHFWRHSDLIDRKLFYVFLIKKKIVWGMEFEKSQKSKGF